MKSATPKPQGKGAQLPNVPKQPASTSSYTSRETYQRGGSDRVSYQRKPRPNVKPKPVAKVGLGKKVLRALSKVKNPRVAAALGLGALSAGMITTAVRGIRKKHNKMKVMSSPIGEMIFKQLNMKLLISSNQNPFNHHNQ